MEGMYGENRGGAGGVSWQGDQEWITAPWLVGGKRVQEGRRNLILVSCFFVCFRFSYWLFCVRFCGPPPDGAKSKIMLTKEWLAPVGVENCRVSKKIIAGKNIDHTSPGRCRSAQWTHHVDPDKSWSGRKRICLSTGAPNVVHVARGTVVGGECGGSVGDVVVEKGKLTEGQLEVLVGRSMVYERRSRRIQLPRLRRIGCCIVPERNTLSCQGRL